MSKRSAVVTAVIITLCLVAIAAAAFALGRGSGDEATPTTTTTVPGDVVQAQALVLTACETEKQNPPRGRAGDMALDSAPEYIHAHREGVREAAVLAEEAAVLDEQWDSFAEAMAASLRDWDEIVTTWGDPAHPSAFEDMTPWTVANGDLARDVLNDGCRSVGVVRLDDVPEDYWIEPEDDAAPVLAPLGEAQQTALAACQAYHERPSRPDTYTFDQIDAAIVNETREAAGVAAGAGELDERWVELSELMFRAADAYETDVGGPIDSVRDRIFSLCETSHYVHPFPDAVGYVVRSPPIPTPPPAPALLPGQPCSLGSDYDCIDPDGDGQGVYLIGGGDCMATIGGGLCSDLDGDGYAGYPDSG